MSRRAQRLVLVRVGIFPAFSFAYEAFHYIPTFGIRISPILNDADIIDIKKIRTNSVSHIPPWIFLLLTLKKNAMRSQEVQEL